MRRAPGWLAVPAVLLALVAAPTEAQTLAPGTWGGHVIDPGGDQIDVSFSVRQSDSLGLQISMAGPDGMSFEFTEVRFESGKLMFLWSPGIEIKCVLEPGDGGSYQGTCTDEEGASGTMVMRPPAG